MIAPARPASAPASAKAARDDRGGADAVHLGGERVVGVGAPFAPGARPAKDDQEREPRPRARRPLATKVIGLATATKSGARASANG